jgi:hypothetical protein
MKMPKLSLIGFLSLVLLVLFACQKDLKTKSEADLGIPSKPGGGGTPPTGEPAFDLSLPDADVTCATSATYCFNTSLLNHGGQTVGGNTTIHAEIIGIVETIPTVLYTSENLNASQGAVCFSGLVLTPGSYTVKVYYDHVANENAVPQHGNFSFPLTVQTEEQCGTTSCETTGLTFSRTPVVILDQTLKPIQVDVTYTVTNCSTDQTYNGLKIQGGLVNKAGEPILSSSGTGLITSYDKKKNGGNFIITGYFNLEPGQYSSFNVMYTVQTACNNPLTGEWSVKNGPIPIISTDLATINPYYVNRLASVCP